MLISKKKKLMLLGISLFVFALFLTGCSGNNTNKTPVIENLNTSKAGFEVTVTGSVIDTMSVSEEGATKGNSENISKVEIAWGDGNSDTINSGFDSINKSYTYDSTGNYNITVTATDNEGEMVSQSINVSIKNLELVDAVASSKESSEYVASNAIDDDSNTRWASETDFSSSQWIYVDLGSVKEISSLRIEWEATATTYRILISDDASNWTQIVSDRTLSSNFVTENINVSATGRYVKIEGDGTNGTDGISIYEIDVYQ